MKGLFEIDMYVQAVISLIGLVLFLIGIPTQNAWGFISTCVGGVLIGTGVALYRWNNHNQHE